MSLLDETIAGGQSGHLTDHDQIAKKLNGQVDLYADFDAAGDGSGDDTSKLVSALGAADLLFLRPGKSFRLTADVTRSTDLVIYGPHARIVEDGGSLVLSGSISNSQDLTSTVSPHERDIPVTSAAGFTVGDTVLLKSTYFSEYLTVESIASNTVTVSEFVQGKYESAQTPTLSLVTTPRISIIGVEFHSASSGNAKHLRGTYLRHFRAKDCKFSGPGTSAVNFSFTDCYDPKFDDCTLEGMTYKGLRFIRGQKARFVNGQLYNNSDRPLMATGTLGVKYLGNIAQRNAGFLYEVEHCRDVTISLNESDQVPQLVSEATTTATSRSGIWVTGSQQVLILGNQVRNALGEGDIYLRSANNLFADGTSEAWPLKDILIAENTIIDAFTSAHSSHVAAIFGKDSSGTSTNAENIRIVNNVIRSASGGIDFRGSISNIEISDNDIVLTGSSAGNKVAVNLTNDPDDSTSKPRSAKVNRNTITSDVVRTTSLVGMFMDTDPDLEFCNNTLVLTGQSGSNDSYLVSINSEDGDLGSGTARIVDNTVRADGGNYRGISIGLTGEPSVPRAYTQTGNKIDVPNTTKITSTGRAGDGIRLGFTDGDTTPYVGDGTLFEANNSGSTTITDFDGGYVGQVITIYSANGNTTVSGGSAVRLAGGSNFTMTSRDTLTLRKTHSTEWHEMSRSAN